jgi:hypothetical protein
MKGAANRAIWRPLLRKIGRRIKYKFVMLLRAKGGAAKVASGFSIGLAVEMFTLPTLGLAFFLIFPLVYLFRASLAGALIGFLFGKTIYVPVAFVNAVVGDWIVSDRLERWTQHLPPLLEQAIGVNLKLLVGGIIDGAALGVLAYFPVKRLLQLYAAKREEKRKRDRAKKTSKP